MREYSIHIYVKKSDKPAGTFLEGYLKAKGMKDVTVFNAFFFYMDKVLDGVSRQVNLAIDCLRSEMGSPLFEKETQVFFIGGPYKNPYTRKYKKTFKLIFENENFYIAQGKYENNDAFVIYGKKSAQDTLDCVKYFVKTYDHLILKDPTPEENLK